MTVGVMLKRPLVMTLVIDAHDGGGDLYFWCKKNNKKQTDYRITIGPYKDGVWGLQ